MRTTLPGWPSRCLWARVPGRPGRRPAALTAGAGVPLLNGMSQTNRAETIKGSAVPRKKTPDAMTSSDLHAWYAAVVTNINNEDLEMCSDFLSGGLPAVPPDDATVLAGTSCGGGHGGGGHGYGHGGPHR